MSTENLTRDEAGHRAVLLSDVAYDVTLDLTTGSETFGVVVEATFACATPGAASFLDATCEDVAEVVLNGVPLDPADVVSPTRIALPDLAASNTVRVVATMAYRHEGKGLHRFVDPSDDRVYLHSQFEPFDAHLVYPCFDQPDLKAPFTFTVEAPAEWVVVSNEPAAEQPSEGAAGTWRFGATPRVSPYITAIVAGSYSHFEIAADELPDAGPAFPLPLGFYVRRSLAEHLEPDLPELVEVTRQGLAWMADAFGHPYPFSSYDQLFVPEFSAGAMENPGCITFSESYVFRSKVTDASRERRAEVVLHEMAHMWFGDLVTMRWWDDLWLNESFATFISVLSQVEATRFDGAWTTFLDAEKAWALSQDQMPSTHPIAADMVDIASVHQNFDGITYAKGASVLRQLVAWVGQEEFLAGCRAYFRDHAWGNAALADFLAALEESSGRELATWTDEWLRTTGPNTFTPQVTLADDGTYHEVVVLQTADDQHPTLRRHRLAVGVYDLADGSLTRRERVELDVEGARTVVADLQGVRAGDVLLVNDDDLTYGKLRLDDASTAVLTDHLDGFTSSLPRALAWSATWDMVRDGELTTGTYVDIVVGNVATEDDIGVLQRLLLRARSAVDRYGDPARCHERMDRLARQARTELTRAQPGSDVQLAWVRHWISCARTDAHTTEVAELLDGGLEIAGLTVDTDLRWHAVVALAAAGAADEARIAAELDRDPTDLGARNAATARAALPDVAAKEAAWERLQHETGLSHTMGRQLWAGLFQLHQPDVLAGFDERYLAAVEGVWRDRSIDWAIEWTQGCFPHPLASDELLAGTDRLLAEGDLPDPARRALVEQRDTLRRTLVARAADTAG